ncbi:hypothetical protein BDV26DRAFT_298603 [Aspergillus bertholletiae]|uniref:BZIP domain-containing protein n=1 Tax=Aspergillus bertholletiae TaxID=1226010 RepID=A0A5N7AP63_9EURO|nr:hypothetical protein BDV26DRAFT_298603 [Aspergillus bertholletiae]
MAKGHISDLRPWQVERRRDQNSAAQRRRRQKQKELHRRQETPPSQTVAKSVLSLSNDLISVIFSCLESNTERANVAAIMAAENFSLRDVVKYGMISLGYVVDPEFYRVAEDLAFRP